MKVVLVRWCNTHKKKRNCSMSIISHPNGWNGFAVKCVSQRANLTIAHTTYRYIPARTVERKRWHIWCQIGRYWARGGGGLLRHDGLPIASQNVHYASLKLFEKIQTAKKEFNVHKVLYIHCTQRIVHFCVCVCVSVTNLYVYRKKKKKEKNMQYTLSYRSLLHD